jgi:tripartite ATP-independent transporter DctM subunit
VSTPAGQSTTEGNGAPPGTWLERALVALLWFERALVTLLLLLMILLPAVAAVLRKVSHRELIGASQLAQHITLWIGFLGAALSTVSGSHLSLSTLDLMKPGWRRRSGAFYGHAVSASVCAVLAVASWGVMKAFLPSLGEIGFGIRESWSSVVMPVGFAVMALRFAWRADAGGPRSWGLRAGALAFAGAAFLLGLVTPGAFTIGLLLVLLAAAFLLGAPVFVVMAGVAMVLFYMGGDTIKAVPSAIFNLSTKESLPAIPLLTAAGYVLAEGGAARRLVRAFKGFFGWMPGGVAVMATVVCAVFTTFTGASGVTILALGGLLLPALVEDKYPEDFSVGLVTGAGSLGLLFPPSLPVYLYAFIAGAPIKELFIGGFLPGLLMIVLVAGYGVWVGRRSGAPREPFRWGRAFAGLWEARWDLGLPALVVGTFLLGWTTIVEAAALGAAYSLFVELVVYRSIHPLRDLPRVLVHAAALVGSVLILLGSAYGLNEWFVLEEFPTKLVGWMTVHVPSPWLFLLALNVVLLVLGSVLEMYSAIVVAAPLLAPLGVHYGIDPVHLGVIFLANLELGFLFPPMGLNLFLSASRFKKPLPWVYRKAMPFLLIMTFGVLVITYVPGITSASRWLWNAVAAAVHFLVHAIAGLF